MNITQQTPNLSIPTVINPATESLRRENNQKNIISQPAAMSQSAAEKGVASDKERGRTPAQNNEQFDFANLKAKAALANNTVSEQSGDESAKQEPEQEFVFSFEQPSEQDVEQSAKLNQEEIDKGEVSENRQSSNQTNSNSQEALAQKRVIDQLKSRDTEVRQHEQAHQAVGGSTTGTASYTYTTGPDGKKYAVNGEVSVDLSSVKGDPRATIAKMQRVHAAALAPVNPSVQDTRVASSATKISLQAQSEMLAELGNEFSELKAKKAHNVNENGSFDTTLSHNDVEGKLRSEVEDFDTQINRTLAAQEAVVPTRSVEIAERAGRIESFYSDITQAYEKPARHQFELSA